MFDFLIFKAYDIRGIYPKQINEDFVYDIGRAYLDFIREKEKVDEPKIVIGRDARLSSDRLFESLAKGITKQGGDVFDIGYSTTPMLYFGVNFLSAHGGIMITASHNPAEYNGLKLTREQAIPISEDTGLKDIQKKIKDQKFKEKETKEAIVDKPILPYYIDFLLAKANITLKEKVVIDAANAMTAIILPSLLKKLKINYIPLFFDVDCTFPNHEANPFKEETLDDLKKLMKKEKASLGIAFDGDGDRIVFLDEDRNVIRGEFITALLAEKILKKKKGKILYDLRSIWTPAEAIKKSGGEPIVSRVGHSMIKQQMRKEKALFAGETSGHYFFKDFFGCESALLTMIKVFEILSETKKSLKELVKPLNKYFHSSEINFEVKNKEKVIKILEKSFKQGNISHLDGLTIEFDDWWFNVRPSNTEPLLRLNLETKKKEDLKKKIKQIEEIIKKQKGIRI